VEHIAALVGIVVDRIVKFTSRQSKNYVLINTIYS